MIPSTPEQLREHVRGWPVAEVRVANSGRRRMVLRIGHTSVTFKKAPKAKGKTVAPTRLDFDKDADQ